MVSLSKQKAISDIGKKGFVLGSDDDWDYFYTNHEGLSKPGLGWVRSYMYDSWSVAVYCEADSVSPRVRFGIFKWINAGWGNINFVKNKHIYGGLARFAKTFKKLLEYPFAPPVDEMARSFSKIGGLTDTQLKEKTKEYFVGLRHRYPGSKILSAEHFSQLFADNGYLAKMKKEEMQSVLALEYMKSLLDRPHTVKEHRAEGFKDKKG